MILFHLFKSFAQYVAVVFSIFTNLILIVLVLTNSPKKIGNYKYLMAYFGAMSMIYAVLDFLVQPYLYSYGHSFSMIMDLRDSVFQTIPRVAFVLTSSLAACFGVTIYAIAVNFVYRFFAIERQNRIRYFAGHRLFLWMLIPIAAGVMWLSVAMFALEYDQEMADYLRTSINHTYSLDSREVTFTGCLYFRQNGNGKLDWCWEDTLGAVVLSIMLHIPFFIICFFGFKSHKLINCIVSSGESEYSKRLQKQLHNALVAQTIIPMIFLFFPIGILFTTPLLNLDMSNYSIFASFFYTFYPAVDPIPTLYYVDEFRDPISNFFRRKMNKNQIASVISFDLNFP
ncbi:unnamed protein product [Caenorhabditis brenneri]